MISTISFKKMALSFAEAEEAPHFEKTSYRIKKRIFATLDEKEQRVCLKFNEIDQSVFCSFDKNVIYPVPNKWGKQGWTLVELKKVKKETLMDALTTSYCEVAPKKLAEAYRK